MANERKDTQQGPQSGGGAQSRSDTLAEGGDQPVQGQAGAPQAGAAGGTDAQAGARMSGSKGGVPGGAGMREQGAASGVPGSPGGNFAGDAISPGAGGGAAGGTGLGEVNSASDSRVGSGTSAGRASVPGGDPSSGAKPPPGKGAKP